MDEINIAVIDDHDLFREGIKLVLNQIEGFKIVFDTSDGNQFVDALSHLKVDIALMDIEMPAINGIQATINALRVNQDLKVIALTMFSDTGHYTQMINAGVKGFILKKTNKHELQQAITTVYQGCCYFSQEILKKLAFQSINSNQSNQLTTREMDVLDLICKGLTSQEIACKLFISIKTVEVHRGNIFLKANVRNTAELIIWAIKTNIITIE